MEVLLVYLVLAIVIGAAASSRGRSTVGWVLIALFLSPLLAAILLFVSPDLKAMARDRAHQARVWEAQRDELRRRDRRLAALVASQAPAFPAPAIPAPPRPDPLKALESLASIRDRGIITAEEFEAKKVEILARV